MKTKRFHVWLVRGRELSAWNGVIDLVSTKRCSNKFILISATNKGIVCDKELITHSWIEFSSNVNNFCRKETKVLETHSEIKIQIKESITHKLRISRGIFFSIPAYLQ